MREIEFRGKCQDNGKWYYGNYIHLQRTTYCTKEDYDADKDNDIHKIVFERMTDWGLPNQHFTVDVIPETLGQYTGLTDKNGKKIFEGDVVRGVAYSTETIAVIVWINEIASFGVKYVSRTDPTIIENSSLFKALKIGMHNEHCAEVIGNIYDNPELLKERD